ncbi:alpha-glucosyltransferase [Bacillus phage G]|uniref:Gp313 n=1 Tax=Bacillus phage G TaxID=2884420 RepID=G3MA54_9CAUD|nr:alpha-glucosyltransferase [Bacillus phage G]AEO93572.1 gp313 [Bacillus phage G]
MTSLKGKKLALIFGLSIEGAGATRNGSEMQHWCDKNGVQFKIFSYDESKFTREESHKISYTKFNKYNLKEVVDELNTYDIVMFNTYPFPKVGQEAYENFYHNFVKKITALKVGFMHEINKVIIDKIPYILGLMNEMDMIYTFGVDTWFSKNTSTLLPSKKPNERIKKFTMWFNFELLEEYRKTIQLDDKEKKMLYLGRFVSTKDVPRVLNLGAEILKKDSNFKTIIRGIDTSIGAKVSVLDHPNAINYIPKEPKVNSNGCVPVYGPYVRDEGMNEMAHSLFGVSFWNMQKRGIEEYGDRMEYTQIETIAVGTIPVFDKHWGENNRTLDGRRYIDIPYSAIYCDRENLNETVDKLIEVANNKELQEKYRNTSYNLAKQEFDASIVLPKMFNEMLAIGKDKKKFKSDDELLLAATGHPEFVKDAKELIEQGETIVFGYRELPNKILSVTDGSKQKEIKKYKK